MRLLQQQHQQHQNTQQQQQKQQQHLPTSSQVQRSGLQTHQKPVSSVAPSFPVKSPIYQTSSTKIHPVMPQTLSLIGRGHPATGQNYGGSGSPQNQNNRGKF